MQLIVKSILIAFFFPPLLAATAAVQTGELARGIASQTGKQPNILFLAIDDLRPELGCYGSEIAVSPNIDKLASQGLLFKRAYCQEPICAPSRASLLTGTRPDTNGIIHNYIRLRERNPDILTLPQHFGNNGYETVYLGKIFHQGDQDDRAWNRKPTVDGVIGGKMRRTKSFALAENIAAQKKTRNEMEAKYGPIAKRGLAHGPAYESADVPDNTYRDGYHTDVAIETLNSLVAEGDKPFFLALGMQKPHLNWVAPKRYWDMYDRDAIQLPQQTMGPKNGAAVGLHPSFELRVRGGIPKIGEFDPELSRTLKHAYLACVSYVDAQIGRMIEALENAGVRDNTIIILWSDHGYHLGEMGIWCKATNYEIATRVPMMIWTPDMNSGGQTTDGLVELIDIFPTLCELAGIERPSGLEGVSFKPLIDNPNRDWKQAAFSQFPSPALREWAAFPIRPAMRETYFGPLLNQVETKIIKQMGDKWDRDLFENDLMGYAMRTRRYRLVLWKDTTEPERPALFTELYDHSVDPQETKNVASENPLVVAALTKQFESGWNAAGPPKTAVPND